MNPQIIVQIQAQGVSMQLTHLFILPLAVIDKWIRREEKL